MPRYIDADVLKERLEDFSKWCRDGRKQGVDFVLDCPLPDIPTADVVPRSEVEKAKQEVAREIIHEFKNMVINYVKDRDLLLVAFKNAVAYAEAELKKKYQ